MQSEEEDALRTYHAIERLAYLIDEPAQRQRFAKDPYGAAQRAGISLDDVPQDLVDTLAALTPEEWAVLDKVKAPLTQAGALKYGAQFL